MFLGIKDVKTTKKREKMTPSQFISAAWNETKRDASYIVVYLAGAAGKVLIISMGGFGNVLL